jgi:acyl carrier protein
MESLTSLYNNRFLRSADHGAASHRDDGPKVFGFYVGLFRSSRLADIQREVISILTATLNLKGGAAGLSADSLLLGAVPELDSMAVATVLTSLEERFGFIVADDEIDGSTFASVGTLTDFVKAKLSESGA